MALAVKNNVIPPTINIKSVDEMFKDFNFSLETKTTKILSMHSVTVLDLGDITQVFCLENIADYDCSTPLGLVGLFICCW